MGRLLAGLLVACLASPSVGGTLDRVMLGISWGELDSKNPCTGGGAPLTPGCAVCCGDHFQFTSVPPGPTSGGFAVYIVVMDIDPEVGLLGLDFALDFNDTPGEGAWFGSSTFSCADAEFPEPGWPGTANSGVTLRWLDSNCQDTPDPNDPHGQAVTVAYTLYCYAYGEDSVAIVPKHDGVFSAMDCSLQISNLNFLYPLNVGELGLGSKGWNPCGTFSAPVPIEETTWGAIKTSYGKQTH